MKKLQFRRFSYGCKRRTDFSAKGVFQSKALGPAPGTPVCRHRPCSAPGWSGPQRWRHARSPAPTALLCDRPGIPACGSHTCRCAATTPAAGRSRATATGGSVAEFGQRQSAICTVQAAFCRLPELLRASLFSAGPMCSGDFSSEAIGRGYSEYELRVHNLPIPQGYDMRRP